MSKYKSEHFLPVRLSIAQLDAIGLLASEIAIEIGHTPVKPCNYYRNRLAQLPHNPDKHQLYWLTLPLEEIIFIRSTIIAAIKKESLPIPIAVEDYVLLLQQAQTNLASAMETYFNDK